MDVEAKIKEFKERIRQAELEKAKVESTLAANQSKLDELEKELAAYGVSKIDLNSESFLSSLQERIDDTLAELEKATQFEVE